MTKPVRLKLKVIPSSSRDAIVGWLGQVLKVKVTAPPEKGRANKAVEELFVEVLGLSAGSVSVVGGRSSSIKTIEIRALDKSDVLRLLPAGSDGGFIKN